jgi:hypothetical protein
MTSKAAAARHEAFIRSFPSSDFDDLLFERRLEERAFIS